MDAPVGAPTTQYVDFNNAPMDSWPITVNPYSTRIALWNNSSNLLTLPSVDFVPA